MQIKVNNQYLDYNEPIEIERQVKLFEQVADTSGDFSYSFTIVSTSKNRSIFNLYTIDQSDKIIYQQIPAILEENGVEIYSGFIKVERDREGEIDCSFFSGNTNWMSDLDFNLRDFDFSQYDNDWDISTITSLESATTGIIFPVINTGALETRSYITWHVDDFHPFVYVKSIIQTLLNRNGIKIQGDILNDWRYNYLITSNAKASSPQDEINSRSTKVNRSTTQTINGAFTTVTFPNNTGNYYTGDLWNTGTNKYTADVKMNVSIDITVDADSTGGNVFSITAFVNGSVKTGLLIFPNISNTLSKSVDVLLESGDVLEIIGLSLPGNSHILSATLTITPKRIFNAFTSYMLPDVKAKDYVSDIFSLFNTVINYDANTKILNVNLFQNIIRNPELDISKYIIESTIENDYVGLIDNYGTNNVFTYSECDTDISKNYNDANVYPFGSGFIDSENNLTQPEVNVIESSFIATMEDVKNPFKTFLPKLQWRSLSETNLSDTGASATDPGSGLTFTASGYAVGDLVRISNAQPSIPGDDVDSYNGDWIVSVASAINFRVTGLTYTADATVDIVKLSIDFEDKDEQALLLSVPEIDLSHFTNALSFLILAESGSLSSTGNPATAYFYKPLQGLLIDSYKESLSFGPINIPNAHQITMLDSYWRDFENIIKDPVKLLAQCNFPKSVFDSLFDQPLRIKTSKFNSLFFMSRVTGYQSSHLPCDIEPIKIK